MLSVVIALVGAACNALASVLERKANRDESTEGTVRLGPVLRVLRRPVWLAGLAAVTAGFVCQASALGLGELSLVQPLLVLELPITLPLAAVILGAKLRRADIVSILLLTTGVAALLACLDPSGGDPTDASGIEWAAGLGVGGGIIAGCILAASRTSGGRRAALLGIGTGVAFGLTAALMSDATTRFGHGTVAALESWQTYTAIVAGIMAMFLLQQALRAGLLVAVQPGVTLADPLVAMLWGSLLFDEELRTGWWLIGAVAGGIAIVIGTVKLSQSPALGDDSEQSEAARQG